MGSKTGHAFVLWGTEDARLRQSYQVAYGLYPKDGKLGVFGPVPGGLVDEIADKESLRHSTRFLVAKVTKEQYDASLEERRRFKSIEDFWLVVEKDCVSFTSAVAAGIGLKVPSRNLSTLTPIQYVEALMAENADSEARQTPAEGSGKTTSLGNRTIRDVKESATRQLQDLLAEAEHHPELHYDIVLHVRKGMLSSVTARRSAMRAGDGGIIRGDNACLYIDADDGTEPSSQGAVNATNQLLKLLTRTTPTPSQPFPVSAEDWAAVWTSDTACYLVDAGAGIDSVIVEGRRMFFAGTLLRPSQLDVTGINPPPLTDQRQYFGPGRSYSQFTPAESLWRRQRDRMQHLKDKYAESVTAGESSLNDDARRAADKKRASIAIHSERGFNSRQRILAKRQVWARYQSDKFQRLKTEAAKHAEGQVADMKRMAIQNQRLAGFIGSAEAQSSAAANAVESWARRGLPFEGRGPFFGGDGSGQSIPSAAGQNGAGSPSGKTGGTVGFDPTTLDNPVPCEQRGTVFIYRGGRLTSVQNGEGMPCVQLRPRR